jgi:glucose/arabinose dehydrogenase
MSPAVCGEPLKRVGATAVGCRPGRCDLRGLLLAFGFALSIAITAILLLFPVRPAQGAGSLPTGFVQSRVAGGLTDPTSMALAPDGRIVVAEQAGKLRIIKGGELLEASFLNISNKVDSEGERGLLGVAFDPAFSANNYVYVYYTREATSTGTPAHNRVVRFTANGDEVVAGSEELILRLNNLGSAKNHNGGAIHFGKDGKLYVAVGENAREENAQSLNNLLGKMLRIDKSGTVPTDNPFYHRAEGKNRAIWALGLRNPFTFSFQPGTGTIFINDVGSSQDTAREEINEGIAGANYGWPVVEGEANDSRFTDPVLAYAHGTTNQTGCAITGGTFYNPATVQFPDNFVGDYFFADLCNGWIRRLDPVQGTVDLFKGKSDERPVDLDVGKNSGSLFFLARDTGSVEKIRYVGN